MINFKKVKSVVLSGMLAAASVAGSFTVAAPSLKAEAANDDYAKLLQYSLYFYDANMCGDEVGSKSAITWRGNCHTDDEVPGGFHDAGDHAMFGLPQGFAASVLGWSYYEFKDAYNATGQGDHLKLIMDHFCDFFKRSTKLSGSSVSNFLYQKGDGNEDHAYWGAPEQQGGGRKMFWTSNSASDIAADYAAALALNYINFGNKEDLTYAEALYNFSVQHNKCESNGPNGFYFATGCSPTDEQANAAGWLYIATNNEKYKSDCASKQTQYLGWCDGWDNRGLGAACVYAHITGDWSKVNGFLSGYTNSSSYLCMDDWGSARLNCSMQMSALVASKNSNAGFQNWAQGQMDYILGNNPFNTCLVTGYASNSAKNTHHRAASGYQGYTGEYAFYEGVKTYHPTNGKVLIGALTGGPNKAGQYSDVIDDYMCNEVAVDYNAGLVGAAAGLYHFYKTGDTVSSIEGVDKIYSGGGSSSNTTAPKVTTTTKDNNNNNTTTTSSKKNDNTTTTTKNPGTSTGNGSFEIEPDYEFDYGALGEDERMIGWEWADFGLTSKDVPTKVEVNISASGNLGKWVGAFGSSTTDKEAGYWIMSDEMTQTLSGNSATITWNIPKDIQSIIQTQYNGEIKFGTWWIDCQKFTIDSVKVYTSGGSSSTTTKTTTKTTTTKTTTKTTTTKTTTKPTTTTTKTTTTKTTTKPTTTTTYNNNNNNGNTTTTATLYGDANNDGRVSIADSTAILQSIGNPDKYPLSAVGKANADVIGNGNGVTTDDAIVIQKIDAGLINANSLPIK